MTEYKVYHMTTAELQPASGGPNVFKIAAAGGKQERTLPKDG